MFFVSTRYAKVWKIFRTEEKYADLSVGTSDKKQDGTYENSRWNARAVGHALSQLKAGNIEEGKDYAIINGKLSNVRYKDDDGNWKDNYRLLISEFAPAGSTESKSTSTKATNDMKSEKKPNPNPVDVGVADDGDGELPW